MANPKGSSCVSCYNQTHKKRTSPTKRLQRKEKKREKHIFKRSDSILQSDRAPKGDARRAPIGQRWVSFLSFSLSLLNLEKLEKQISKEFFLLSLSSEKKKKKKKKKCAAVIITRALGGNTPTTTKPPQLSGRE